MLVRRGDSGGISLYIWILARKIETQRVRQSVAFSLSATKLLYNIYTIVCVWGWVCSEDILSIPASIDYMIYIEICMAVCGYVEQNRRILTCKSIYIKKHQNRRFRVIVVYSCWIKIFTTFTFDQNALSETSTVNMSHWISGHLSRRFSLI